MVSKCKICGRNRGKLIDFCASCSTQAFVKYIQDNNIEKTDVIDAAKYMKCTTYAARMRIKGTGLFIMKSQGRLITLKTNKEDD